MAMELELFLHRECGLCSHCASSVIAAEGPAPLTPPDTCRAPRAIRDSDDRCTVCFGLSAASHQQQRDRILPLVRESLLPYVTARPGDPGPAAEAGDGASGPPPRAGAGPDNYLAKESPTVNLPWLVAVRAQCAIAAAQRRVANEADSAARAGVRLRTAEEVYLRIKERVRSSLRRAILDTLHAPNGVATLADADRVVLSPQLHEAETGYLGVHVLCLPPPALPLDEDDDVTQLVPPSFRAHVLRHKPQIQQSQHRILHPRKRFRGNDPTLKQGGDPKINLELRVRRSTQRQPAMEERTQEERGPSGTGEGRMSQGEQEPAVPSPPNSDTHEWNMIISWLEKKTVLQWLEQVSAESSSKQSNDNDLSMWLRQRHQKSISPRHCSIYAASWRRPFYVHGTYTKSRRDISQTPFYVPATTHNCGNGGSGATDRTPGMARKGVSSVEEEICPPLARIGCGGIAVRNNASVPDDSASGTDRPPHAAVAGGKGAIVYGMCKFHASGREDMDVRMLLPPPSVAAACAQSNIVITGRPFVCEIYDAHRMPSKGDLENVVQTINCEEENTAARASACQEREDTAVGENGWPTAPVSPSRFHGRNPRGVGTSSPLTLVPSRVFSGLQAETEGKVKHYGCICWSSVPIASDAELRRKLGGAAWDGEGADAAAGLYPLELRQSTPLRVLHRRASDVRPRRVLSLSARRLGEHWFRLRLSTSAGTYVKEFVHGDCGRTRPSVGAMLGGRADVAELDCEGIVA